MECGCPARSVRARRGAASASDTTRGARTEEIGCDLQRTSAVGDRCEGPPVQHCAVSGLYDQA